MTRPIYLARVQRSDRLVETRRDGTPKHARYRDLPIVKDSVRRVEAGSLDVARAKYRLGRGEVPVELRGRPAVPFDEQKEGVGFSIRRSLAKQLREVRRTDREAARRVNTAVEEAVESELRRTT